MSLLLLFHPRVAAPVVTIQEGPRPRQRREDESELTTLVLTAITILELGEDGDP